MHQFEYSQYNSFVVISSRAPSLLALITTDINYTPKRQVSFSCVPKYDIICSPLVLRDLRLTLGVRSLEISVKIERTIASICKMTCCLRSDRLAPASVTDCGCQLVVAGVMAIVV